eukprot:m.22879 g.22879  ORF g.22879 m.22879 type:complete len:636 (+) comp28418_c0_seq2:184-2091(+)
MMDRKSKLTFIERVREKTRQTVSNPTQNEELNKEIRKALLNTPSRLRFTHLTGFYRLLQQNIVNRPETEALEDIAAAFRNVLKYAGNAVKYKDRKEYRTIRIYNGFYKCNVEALFGDAKVLFEAMGFQGDEGGVLRLPDGRVDEERILQGQVDLVFAEEEIRIIKELLSMKIPKMSLCHVFGAREEVSEENGDALVKNFEMMSFLAFGKQKVASMSVQKQLILEKDEKAPYPVTPADVCSQKTDYNNEGRSDRLLSSGGRSFSWSAMNSHQHGEFEGVPEKALQSLDSAGLSSGKRLPFDLSQSFLNRHTKQLIESDADLDMYGSGICEDPGDDNDDADFQSLMMRAEVNGPGSSYGLPLNSSFMPPPPLQVHVGTDGGIGQEYLTASRPQLVSHQRHDSLSLTSGDSTSWPLTEVNRLQEIVSSTDTQNCPKEDAAESQWIFEDKVKSVNEKEKGESHQLSESVEQLTKRDTLDGFVMIDHSEVEGEDCLGNNGKYNVGAAPGKKQKENKMAKQAMFLQLGKSPSVDHVVPKKSEERNDGPKSWSTPTREQGAVVWDCPSCSFHNTKAENRKVCEMCCKSKDYVPEPSPEGMKCQFCSFVNPAVRSPEVRSRKCPLCGTPYSLSLNSGLFSEKR